MRLGGVFFVPLSVDRVYRRGEVGQMMADMIKTWRDYHDGIEDVVDLGKYAVRRALVARSGTRSLAARG